MQTKLFAPIALALLCLTACGPSKSAENKDLIRDPVQANKAVMQLQPLTEAAFDKMRVRAPLEDEDTANLKKAEPIAQSLVDYDPVELSYASILGKIKLGLGELDSAEAIFKSALLNKPEEKDKAGFQVYAGIADDLGRLQFQKKDFDESLNSYHLARLILPDDPYFMTDQASTLIQLERYQEAKELCRAALKIDPGHTPADNLLKLLKDVPDLEPANESAKNDKTQSKS